MKFTRVAPEIDGTDRAILQLLQTNCKQPLAAIGEKVGLSAPSVVERIHKLEEAGMITGYVALLDARRLGRDVTAFIGVATGHPRAIDEQERRVAAIDEILECHHVTGVYTLVLKVKTQNTASLEALIERVRSIPGVTRTETMVVLSTAVESPRIALGGDDVPAVRPTRPPRRNGARTRRAAQ